MRELKTAEGRYVTVIVGHDGRVSMEFEERARHTKSKTMYFFTGHWSASDIQSEKRRKAQGGAYSRNPYLQHAPKGSESSPRRIPWKGGGWAWIDGVIQNDITPAVMAFVDSDAYQQEKQTALIAKLQRDIQEHQRQIERFLEGIEYEKEDMNTKMQQLRELGVE